MSHDYNAANDYNAAKSQYAANINTSPIKSTSDELIYSMELTVGNISVFVEQKHSKTSTLDTTAKEKLLTAEVNRLIKFINNSSEKGTLGDKFIEFAESKLPEKTTKPLKDLIEVSTGQMLKNTGSAIGKTATKLKDYLKEGLTSVLNFLPGRSKPDDMDSIRQKFGDFVSQPTGPGTGNVLPGTDDSKMEDLSFQTSSVEEESLIRPEDPLIMKEDLSLKNTYGEQERFTFPKPAEDKPPAPAQKAEPTPPKIPDAPLKLELRTLPRFLADLEKKPKLTQEDQETLGKMRQMCADPDIPRTFAASYSTRIDLLLQEAEHSLETLNLHSLPRLLDSLLSKERNDEKLSGDDVKILKEMEKMLETKMKDTGKGVGMFEKHLENVQYLLKEAMRSSPTASGSIQLDRATIAPILLDLQDKVKESSAEAKANKTALSEEDKQTLRAMAELCDTPDTKRLLLPKIQDLLEGRY